MPCAVVERILMTKTKEHYKSLVNEVLTPLLKVRGFDPIYFSSFGRWVDDALWRISPDLVLNRGADSGCVVVYFAVGFRPLTQWLATFDDLEIRKREVRIPGAMATDLGHLRPPFQYECREFSPSDDVAVFGRELMADIEKDGMQFFERWGTVDKMIPAWQSGVSYASGWDNDTHLVAALWLRGRKFEAIAHVEERAGTMRQRIANEGKGNRNMLIRYEAFLQSLRKRAASET